MASLSPVILLKWLTLRKGGRWFKCKLLFLRKYDFLHFSFCFSIKVDGYLAHKLRYMWISSMEDSAMTTLRERMGGALVLRPAPWTLRLLP